MRIEISCSNCDADVTFETDGDEPNTTIDCECGARYAVTVSQLRGRSV